MKHIEGGSFLEQIIFGRTGLRVSRTGFGGIPIQRIPYDESTAILRRAYDSGINLYDTANFYTTSEDRIGIALSDVRSNIVLCTKSTAKDEETLTQHLDNSLDKLRTDYVDVFQFHLPPFVPKPDGEDGLYNAALKAQREGKIRFIGISCHKRLLGLEAAESGLYDVLQFPFCHISTDEEMAVADVCEKNNVGVLGMKPLCGGILTNAKAAFVFLRQYKNIVPIWGIERLKELEEFISYENDPPAFDEELREAIRIDLEELACEFCRGCGYCLPCPAEIPIPMAIRMKFLLARMFAPMFLTEEWQENMRRVDDCTNCKMCIPRCPYGLDIPRLLKEHQKSFYEILAKNG